MRGITACEYVAINDHRKTDFRLQQKPKQVLFTVEIKLHAIKKLMIDKWSPELISVKGKESGECPISHQWLYHWIWESKHVNKRADSVYKKLYKYLKHFKRRRKRGNSKDRRVVIQN